MVRTTYKEMTANANTVFLIIRIRKGHAMSLRSTRVSQEAKVRDDLSPKLHCDFHGRNRCSMGSRLRVGLFD